MYNDFGELCHLGKLHQFGTFHHFWGSHALLVQASALAARRDREVKPVQAVCVWFRATVRLAQLMQQRERGGGGTLSAKTVGTLRYGCPVCESIWFV